MINVREMKPLKFQNYSTFFGRSANYPISLKIHLSEMIELDKIAESCSQNNLFLTQTNFNIDFNARKWQKKRSTKNKKAPMNIDDHAES